MRPELGLTPEEAEAAVADYEARSAHIAATCLPAVKAASKKEERALALSFLYGMHATEALYGHLAAWSAETDGRLASIDTRSRTLRRARAARADITEFIGKITAVVPDDFCAMVTAWQAKGWKGEPPGTEAFTDLFADASDVTDRRMRRGTRLLRRHGATRAQIRAFNEEPRWPELREPAKDLVAEAIGGGPPARTSPDEGGRREPWAVAASADAR
jgi:hypothetical protein